MRFQTAGKAPSATMLFGKERENLRAFMSILPLVLIAGMCSNSPALADLVIVELGGIVNDIDTYGGLTFDGSLYVGSPMAGTFTYDSEAPPEPSYPVTSISMTVGNYTFMHDPTSSKSPSCRFGVSYYIRSGAPRFDGTAYINGLPTTYDDADWHNLSILFSLGGRNLEPPFGKLPDADSFPDISAFDLERSFSVGTDNGPYGFDINGEVTSLTIIPEPATLLLLALGGLVLVRKR